MANSRNSNQDFQAPAVYESPDTVLAKLGFADDQARAFIYAEAAIMKVDAGQLDIPENIAEVVKAAEYTRRYGYTPGIHLHMQTFRSKAKRKMPNGNQVEVWEDRISLVVGEQAYKASARILAQREGDHIDFEWEPLTPDEIREYVTANMPKDFELTDEDCGVRARVLSLKDAQIRAAMGRKYDPQWSYGFCFMKGVPRVNNQGVKSYPKSDRDRIPNQRSVLDVAMRRAIKSAIMQKYHLVPLDSLSEEQRVAQVIRDAQPDPTAGWMPRERDDSREANGDVLFYGESGPEGAPGQTSDDEEIDGEYTHVAGDEDLDIDGAISRASTDKEDNPFDSPSAGAQNEAQLPYAEIADSLEGNEKLLAQWSAQRHANSEKGPASKAQYGYLCKAIDDATNGAHTVALSVLCRRYVSGDNPCSAELASKLLDWILPEVPKLDDQGRKVRDGKKTVYVTNEKFRQDIVDTLAAIARHVQALRERREPGKTDAKAEQGEAKREPRLEGSRA